MEEKKKTIEKIMVSRRLLVKSKLIEESKVSSAALLHLQTKHLQILQQLHILHTAKIAIASERLIWDKERTQFFWETDFQQADESIFRNNFRMSRKLFNKLCELLPALQKNYTKMRDSISLQKGIAIALYALGSSTPYRTIGKMFGVDKSALLTILLRFCGEVWRVLAPIYLNSFPLTKEKIETLVKQFEELGFPQCMGAIDTCHIAIHPSKENAKQYFNYKGWYSVVLLALVDARQRFIYVDCGNPGRFQDSAIFQRSSLKKYLDQSSLLNDLNKSIFGMDVPALIIGDSAFQLSDKLMAPYPFRKHQSQQQKRFNYALSKSHKMVQNAFAHLKARFRRIRKGIGSIRNTNAIVLSCCVLHNFLNENNDMVNEKWLQALKMKESKRSYPEHNILLADLNNNSIAIRNAIASYFNESVDGESERMDVNGESGGFDGDSGDSSIDGDGNGEETFMDEDSGSGTMEEFMPEIENFISDCT